MKKNTKKKIKKIFLYTIIGFFGSTILITILYAFVPVYITPYMLIQTIGKKDVHIKKTWVSHENISSELVLAVISSEDQLFVEHHGFDFDAIYKALKQNKNGKKMKGASTISQQTAKNVFLWPSRSWFRKILEVYFATLIEFIWSKRRIMEVYLNVIEMGKGVYGAQAAAQHYFLKPAKNVNRYEAAMIAAILPSPVKYNLNYPGSYIFERQDWILEYMYKLKYNPEVRDFLKKW